MGIDAGTVYSEVRIRLSALSADITSAGTALDNLGAEWSRSADKYSNISGKKYKAALESIAQEMKNVVAVAQSSAITEGQAIDRLIQLRKEELRILQDRAVKEGTVSAETVAAIQKTQGALEKLEGQQKELGVASENTGSTMLSKFRDLQSVMQGPVAAARAVINVIKQVSAAVAEMEAEWTASAAAEAKLIAIHKSVGAEAWVMTGHLIGMSEAIAKTTLYNHEEVQSMEAVLLGFRKIQGVNFDRAVQSIVDMSTVMGGEGGQMSLVSAAQAIGKALDDPIAGIDSLTRQGFRWTEQEKAMLKEMVNTGNIAGAQKIILDELAKTFGGASEAVAKHSGALKEMANKAIGELKEEMGRGISSSGFMTKWRQAITDQANEWADALKKHNDYKDTIAKFDAGEELTRDEKLIKLEGDLEAIQRKRYRLASEGLSSKSMPILASYDTEIAALQEQIRLFKAAAVARAKSAASIGQSASTQAATVAAAEAWQAEITKKRTKIVEAYQAAIEDVNRQEKARILTSDKASDARKEALSAEISALNTLINTEGIKKGITTDLRDAEEKRYAELLSSEKDYQKAIDLTKTRLDAGRITYKQSLEEQKAATEDYIDKLIESGDTNSTQLNGAITLWKSLTLEINSAIRAFSTQEQAQKTYVKGKVDALKELAAADSAEYEAIQKSVRDAGTAAVVKAIISKRYVANKIADMKAVADADNTEHEAIQQGVRDAETASVAKSVISKRFIQDKKLEIKGVQDAAGVEYETIQQTLRDDDAAEVVRETISKRYVRAKLLDIKEVRDADIAAINALLEAESNAERTRINTGLITKKALKEKKDGIKAVTDADEVEYEAVQQSVRDADIAGTIKGVISERYIQGKQEEIKINIDAEKTESDAIQKSIRDAETASEIRGVIAKRFARDKLEEIKAAKDADSAEYEIIQKGLRDAVTTAEIKKVVDGRYLKGKVDAIREAQVAEQSESDALHDHRAQEEQDQARLVYQYTSYSAMRAAAEKELLDLKKKNLTPLLETESTITQITGTEAEKQIDIVKQNLAKDLLLYKDNAAIKKALMEQATDDILRIQIAAFKDYADVVINGFSSLISSIDSMQSSQADAAIDAIDYRLEALKKSYGSTASALQTMYDSLLEMGATDAAATVKAQLDKEKAIEDYTSLTIEELQTLRDASVAMNNDTTTSYIDAAMARVQADKDAAVQKNQLEYDSAVASWENKKLLAIADTAQAIMNGLLTKPFMPLGLAMGVVAGGLGVAQQVDIQAAKPVFQPVLDTGGLVLADRSRDTSVDVGRGTSEIMFGTSAIGSPLMEAFAELVASKVAMTGTPIILQVTLKDRVIAESTVELINNGQVRLKR